MRKIVLTAAVVVFAWLGLCVYVFQAADAATPPPVRTLNLPPGDGGRICAPGEFMFLYQSPGIRAAFICNGSGTAWVFIGYV